MRRAEELAKAGRTASPQVSLCLSHRLSALPGPS